MCSPPCARSHLHRRVVLFTGHVECEWFAESGRCFLVVGTRGSLAREAASSWGNARLHTLLDPGWQGTAERTAWDCRTPVGVKIAFSPQASGGTRASQLGWAVPAKGLGSGQEPPAAPPRPGQGPLPATFTAAHSLRSCPGEWSTDEALETEQREPQAPALAKGGGSASPLAPESHLPVSRGKPTHGSARARLSVL